MGLAPIGDPSPTREQKRKFRKVFNKFFKPWINSPGMRPSQKIAWEEKFGIGNQTPTPLQKNNRKNYVREIISKNLRLKYNFSL